MKTPRMRLDQLLFERGLAGSREKAKALILAGQVKVNGQRSDKAGKEIELDATIDVAAPPPYVSRGGHKLAQALDHWQIDPTNKVCLDIGSSTGGFTEVLLNEGASLVHAIDVGRDQLHPSLRGHPKIVSREETDIRSLAGRRLDIRPSIVVIDVSFISLKHVLPVALELAAVPTTLLALIKPQFEAPRSAIKKGIVKKVFEALGKDAQAEIVKLA